MGPIWSVLIIRPSSKHGFIHTQHMTKSSVCLAFAKYNHLGGFWSVREEDTSTLLGSEAALNLKKYYMFLFFLSKYLCL